MAGAAQRRKVDRPHRRTLRQGLTVGNGGRRLGGRLKKGPGRRPARAAAEEILKIYLTDDLPISAEAETEFQKSLDKDKARDRAGR